VAETYQPAPEPPYAIELTCDGITVRYEAPTAEDVLRLRELARAASEPPIEIDPEISRRIVEAQKKALDALGSKRESREECPPFAFIRTEGGKPVLPGREE
jgi:hypothetical protein